MLLSSSQAYLKRQICAIIKTIIEQVAGALRNKHQNNSEYELRLHWSTMAERSTRSTPPDDGIHNGRTV